MKKKVLEPHSFAILGGGALLMDRKDNSGGPDVGSSNVSKRGKFIYRRCTLQFIGAGPLSGSDLKRFLKVVFATFT